MHTVLVNGLIFFLFVLFSAGRAGAAELCVRSAPAPGDTLVACVGIAAARETSEAGAVELLLRNALGVHVEGDWRLTFSVVVPTSQVGLRVPQEEGFLLVDSEALHLVNRSDLRADTKLRAGKVEILSERPEGARPAKESWTRVSPTACVHFAGPCPSRCTRILGIHSPDERTLRVDLNTRAAGKLDLRACGSNGRSQPVSSFVVADFPKRATPILKEAAGPEGKLELHVRRSRITVDGARALARGADVAFSGLSGKQVLLKFPDGARPVAAAPVRFALLGDRRLVLLESAERLRELFSKTKERFHCSDDQARHLFVPLTKELAARLNGGPVPVALDVNPGRRDFVDCIDGADDPRFSNFSAAYLADVTIN